MLTVMEEMKLRMKLMEGKEFKLGINIPSKNPKECVETALKDLARTLEDMNKNDDNYKMAEDGKIYQLSIELFKTDEHRI
jgi:hypothetical protein